MKLYDLIHGTPWQTIKESLIKLYPDITESKSNLNGFESAYNDMLKLTPVKCDKCIYFSRLYRDNSGCLYRDVFLRLPNKRKQYSPMTTSWSEMLSMEIKSANPIPEAEMAATIIWEMTYFGFSEKKTEEWLEELEKRSKWTKKTMIYFEAVIGAGACGRNIIRKAKRRKFPDTLVLYYSQVKNKLHFQMELLKEMKIVVGLGGNTGINNVKEILNYPYTNRPKIELYAVMPFLAEGKTRNSVAREQLQELTKMVDNVTLFELDQYKTYYEKRYHKPCSILRAINATDQLICKKLSSQLND